MRILNLTQHVATPEQVEAGVVDLSPEERKELSSLLTFTAVPSTKDLQDRAYCVCKTFLKQRAWVYGPPSGWLGGKYDAVLLGGAPFFMENLADCCRRWGYKTLFAFSRRESVEEVQKDGSVRKVAVFRHLGFVEVGDPDPPLPTW